MRLRIDPTRNRLYTEFGHDKRGSVAMIFGITALIGFGSIGMAVDYGMALRAKTQLRAAVDQGAIAGASLPATAAHNRVDKATKFFKAGLSGTPMENVTPSIQASNSGVVVAASWNYPTSFLKLFNIDHFTVTARTLARSQVQNGGVACIIALNPTSVDGLHIQGVNKISSSNCWTWVNSTDSASINAVGASTGTAQGFCTAGGVVGGEHFTPHPYVQCDPIADPFETQINAYNASTTCTHTDLQLANGTYTLNPGVYCGNTRIKPQADVTLNPGTYIFKGGELEVQAQATLRGDGVTLFFTHLDTRFDIRGGASVDLKAPATGTLAGFVIVDRKIDWYDSSIRESTITGGGAIKLEGIVYVPQWKLVISGNGELNQDARFTAIVADTIYMEGSGRIFVKSDATGAGLPDLMPRIKNGPLLLN